MFYNCTGKILLFIYYLNLQQQSLFLITSMARLLLLFLLLPLLQLLNIMLDS